MSQTSSPNRAIKSRKQQSTPITAVGRRTYRKSQLSPHSKPQKAWKLVKQSR